MKRTLLVSALSFSAVVGTLRAQATISTLGDWNASRAQTFFGEPDTGYFGQTLTVPGDARLVSYEFRVEQLSLAPTQYQSSVYLWDTINLRATGSSLYTSSASTFDFIGGGFAPVSFTLPGGGIDLTTGQVILLMFDAITPGDTVASSAQFGLVVPGTLAGGEARFLNSFAGANSPTITSWSPVGGDFAFRADFVFAPEPSTWGAGTAAVGLVIWRLASARAARRSATRV